MANLEHVLQSLQKADNVLYVTFPHYGRLEQPRLSTGQDFELEAYYQNAKFWESNYYGLRAAVNEFVIAKENFNKFMDVASVRVLNQAEGILINSLEERP